MVMSMAVLAQDTSDDSDDDSDERDDDSEATDESDDDSDDKNDDSDRVRPKVREQLRANAGEAVPVRAKVDSRRVAIDRLKSLRSDYVQARNTFRKVQANHQERREQWQTTKDELKECEDTDECTALRERIHAQAQDYLISGIEMIIDHLNQIASKAETSESLTDEQKAEIIGQVDEQIEELNALIEDVENAETKEELKEAAMEVRELWKRIAHLERINAYRLVHHRVDMALDKTDTLIERLQNQIDKLEGDAKSEAEELMNALQENLDLASDKFAEAEDLLKEARDLAVNSGDREEIKDLISQARDASKEASRHMKAAHEAAREILKVIADSKEGSVDSDEEDNDSIDDDSEEESDGESGDDEE